MQQRTSAAAPLPPLRKDPFTRDERDGDRAEYFANMWRGQDVSLMPSERTAEEVIRFISGQQWVVWSDSFNRFLDVSEYLTDDELRWNPRPVINRMLPWFMLTHSRLTENPPIWNCQPATADREDAEMAETWDVITKTMYRKMNMPARISHALAWVVATGRSHIKFVMDYSTGIARPIEGPATLSLVGPDGQPIERYLDRAPYGRDGQPRVTPVEGSLDEFEAGEADTMREGELQAVVLSRFECRGEWNHNKAWHEKHWHHQRSMMTVAEVYARTGIEVQPDLSRGEAERGQEMARMLFGSGNYAQSMPFGYDSASVHISEDMVLVDEHWRAPSDSEGTPETDDSPGGRFYLGLPLQKRTLIDAERPVRCPYTSPIHALGFVGVPGRPSETSPGEPLLPLQRAINRGAAQVIEYRNKLSNPIELVDKGSGLHLIKRTNRPGERIAITMRANVDPIKYVVPPTVSGDVWKSLDWLDREFDRMGGLDGQTGSAPTRDASGALVEELRENSDRFYGGTARANVEEVARMQETVIAYLQATWDQEKVIAYAGADNIHRTLTYYPDLMRTLRLNVVPDVESMLPEGRGARQARIDSFFEKGGFGTADDPTTVSRYAEASKFPHPYRMYMPGEVHRRMAQHELGRLLQGASASEIAFLPYYNDEIHIQVFEEFLAGPEYLRQTREVQTQILAHHLLHVKRYEQAMLAAEQAAMQQAAMAAGPAKGAAATDAA